MALAAGTAQAEYFVGQPIVVTNGPAIVTVSYVGSDAGWDGVLWLDGDSSASSLEVPLFFNHDNVLGNTHNLGIFQAGQRIDFIYDILTGVNNTFRTDDPTTSAQFRWEWTAPDTIRVGVEDIKLPGGDGDYNDMVFDVSMMSVPAPGAAVGLAMLGAVGLRRRRRN